MTWEGNVAPYFEQRPAVRSLDEHSRYGARRGSSLARVTNDAQRLKIGVLGCGNVGAAVVRIVEAQRATVERRTG